MQTSARVSDVEVGASYRKLATRARRNGNENVFKAKSVDSDHSQCLQWITQYFNDNDRRVRGRKYDAYFNGSTAGCDRQLCDPLPSKPNVWFWPKAALPYFDKVP